MRESEGGGEGEGFHLGGIEDLLHVFLGEYDPPLPRPDSVMRNLPQPGHVVDGARSYAKKLCNFLHLVSTHS